MSTVTMSSMTKGVGQARQTELHSKMNPSTSSFGTLWFELQYIGQRSWPKEHKWSNIISVVDPSKTDIEAIADNSLILSVLISVRSFAGRPR